MMALDNSPVTAHNTTHNKGIAMSIRKKTAAKKKTAPKKKTAVKKPKTGGSRSGSGRKPLGDEKMRSGAYVRLEEEQRAALESYISKLNAKRAKAGVKPIKLSTWLRELALKHSGNEELGAAGKAAAAAKAASVL